MPAPAESVFFLTSAGNCRHGNGFRGRVYFLGSTDMDTMQIVLIVLLLALIAAFVVIRKKQNK